MKKTKAAKPANKSQKKTKDDECYELFERFSRIIEDDRLTKISMSDIASQFNLAMANCYYNLGYSEALVDVASAKKK